MILLILPVYQKNRLKTFDSQWHNMAHSGHWLGVACGLRSLRSLSPQATPSHRRMCLFVSGNEVKIRTIKLKRMKIIVDDS